MPVRRNIKCATRDLQGLLALEAVDWARATGELNGYVARHVVDVRRRGPRDNRVAIFIVPVQRVTP